MAKDESAKLLDPGEKAPPFVLKDQDNREHRLENYRGRWLVLYFYPKDDTPGCTKEACGFRDEHQALQDRNAAVLGVSPDDEASHKQFAQKFDLPFPLLADHDAKICQAYGVWREKNMYGRKSIGVMRSTYLIDSDGVVAHRWGRVKVNEHVQQVQDKLDELA